MIKQKNLNYLIHTCVKWDILNIFNKKRMWRIWKNDQNEGRQKRITNERWDSVSHRPDTSEWRDKTGYCQKKEIGWTWSRVEQRSHHNYKEVEDSFCSPHQTHYDYTNFSIVHEHHHSQLPATKDRRFVWITRQAPFVPIVLLYISMWLQCVRWNGLLCSIPNRQGHQRSCCCIRSRWSNGSSGCRSLVWVVLAFWSILFQRIIWGCRLMSRILSHLSF